MSLAIGIGVYNGKFIAEILLKNGNFSSMELSELASEGIPVEQNQQQKIRVQTSFTEWVHTDPSEYLNNFQILIPAGAVLNQAIYTFTSQNMRFLVPALVLIRALFNPTKLAISAAFNAQCLDNIGYHDKTELWLYSKYRYMSEFEKSIWKWMFCFPSAYKMAHSVHEFALNRRIDVSLPKANVNMNLLGQKIKDTVFVSKISFSCITIGEVPSDVVGTNSIETKVLQRKRSKFVTQSGKIPLNRDGNITLSRLEWQEIEPILLANARRKKIKFDRKDIFESVLLKLHHATPWRTVTYKSGNYVNASQVYQIWKKHGAFDKAIQKLTQLREYT